MTFAVGCLFSALSVANVTRLSYLVPTLLSTLYIITLLPKPTHMAESIHYFILNFYPLISPVPAGKINLDSMLPVLFVPPTLTTFCPFPGMCGLINEYQLSRPS